MLFAKALAIAVPDLAVGPPGEMNELNIETNSQPVAGEMAAECEIGVVAVPSVKRCLIKSDPLGHLATGGDEQAVERLDTPVDDLRGAKKFERISLWIAVRHDAARMADACHGPKHRRQPGRARHADNIPLGEMPPESCSQIFRQNLDVVVRKHADVAPGRSQAPVVALAEGAGVVDADDLVGFGPHLSGIRS